MTISRKMKDIMIPLSSAATTTAEMPLKEAIRALRKLYCEVEEGKCTEAGFRTILVLDNKRQIAGILDFQSIIKVLIPEMAGGLSAKARALWESLGAVDTKSHSLDKAKLDLTARIAKNAERPVREIMLKVKGSISADADVLEALMVLCENKVTVLPVYEDDQPVGIIRDSDLFLKIADELGDTEED
jgi:CBS domain-containing protein